MVDLGYERSEPGDREIDTYNAGIGKYVTPNTTVVLSYEQSNLKNGPGGDLKSYGADARALFCFRQRRPQGSRQAAARQLLADWMTPRPGASVPPGTSATTGASALTTNSEDFSGFEVDVYSVNAEWFITESFAVDLAYKDVSPDDINLSGGKLEASYDEVAISALYRF